MISSKSLKIKIPALIIGLVMIAIISTSYISYHIFQENMKEEIVQKNFIITDMISDQVSQYLSNAQSTVEYVAKYAATNDMKSIQSYIDSVYTNYNWMDLMFYMTADGRITYSNPHNDVIYSRNYVNREYYQYMIKYKQTYISKVFVSSILNQPHIIIVAPILDKKTGALKGIIGGGVPLSNIKKVVRKTQETFEGKIYVVDRDGMVLVTPNDMEISEGMSLEREILLGEQEIPLKEVILHNKQGVGEYTNDSEITYVAFSKMKNYEGIVFVEQDQAYVLEQIEKIKPRFITNILLIMLVVLILSIYFAHTITMPIEKLVLFVRGLNRDIDKKSRSFEVIAKDEIGELEQAFDSMRKELSLKMEALKNLHKRECEIKQYLNNILKSVASGIIVIDHENKISVFNTAAEEILGLKQAFFMHKDLTFLLQHSDLPQDIFQDYEKREKNIVMEREYNIPKKDGSIKVLNIELSPVYDEEGKIIGTICLMKDLTRIKILEEHIRREDRLKTIGELSSNLIHEIGNPLAGMTNLLEVLRDNWDEEDLREELLDTLREEVNILNDMVIKFLDFTRAHKNKSILTNIVDVLESAMNILYSEIVHKDIQVIKKIPAQLPLLKMDVSGLRQAFVNLLKNSIQAVDYHGEIRIEVKLLEKGENKLLYISIRDNGLGIPQEKAEQIFNPFFTTKENGTGLGLSIVHKIITDNHGIISVKSEVGKYTEFTICFEGGLWDETTHN
ncbi:ATP-binding protein [Clostridiaceae bacterium 35-E11]